MRHLDDIAKGRTWPDRVLCLSTLTSAVMLGWRWVA